MKVVLQIVAACLVLHVAYAAKGPVAEPVCDVVCPEEYPVTENRHLPYTNDCTKFCHCANDGNWKKDCPPGLHFNAALQVCDWPANAGCESDPGTEAPKPTDAPTNAPTDAPTNGPTVGPTDGPTPAPGDGPSGDCDSVCPNVFPIEENNHLPYPGDCSKFCHCANDGNWEKVCPPGLHFNPTLQVCDWPANAGCEDGPGTKPPTQAPTPAPTNDPGQTTGPTLAPTPLPTDGPTSGPSGNCDDVCPDVFPIEENNHLPYPGDCSKFCHCANDGNWEKVCPPGLHFNPKLQVCDWPANAGCEDGPGTKPPTPKPTQAPTTQGPTQAPTNEPNPTTGPTQAPTDLPTIAPTDGPTSAPGNGCEHVICGDEDCFESANTIDCQAYCKCDHGNVIIKQCSNGLFWNPATGNCDWEKNVQCNVPSPPPPTDDDNDVTTAVVPPVGSCEDVCPNVNPIEDNNHLPFPGDCTKFCHCANDGNWEKDCAPGLHFNADLQVCDWPANANCQV